MLNLKSAQGYKVVGKVENGVLTIKAITPQGQGYIIRKSVQYSQSVVVPVSNKTISNMEGSDMRTNRPTGQTYMVAKKEPAIKKVEAVDVPQFMKDRTKRMQEERIRKNKFNVLV